MVNEEFLEVVVAYGINCCDYDILHLSVFRELIKSVFID
jgi:hypothetical protein